MAETGTGLREIGAVRTLLTSKPRPVGRAERRARIEEVGSVRPVADDVTSMAVDAGGVGAEWSVVPGNDPSRVLLFFHGGGYCSGSLISRRRMVTEAGRAAKIRTLALDYVGRCHALGCGQGAADVAVTIEIWPHMTHAWHIWNAHLDAGRRALARAGAFINYHLYQR